MSQEPRGVKLWRRGSALVRSDGRKGSAIRVDRLDLGRPGCTLRGAEPGVALGESALVVAVSDALGLVVGEFGFSAD